MVIWRDNIKREYIVKLAAMECFASCMLTYLNMSGRNHRLFLLDYWNISYQFRTLLSSKDAKQMKPDFFYGIGMEFVRGSAEDLLRRAGSGSCLILLCAASKLPYFPQRMLGLEASGFQHSILICGRNDATGRFVIVDPMADYIGELADHELIAAGCRPDGRRTLLYFALDDGPDAAFRQPDAERMCAYAAGRNYSFFDPSGQQAEPISQVEWFGNRRGGGKALDLFADDAIASADWSAAARGSWIARNNLTIASIMSVRSMVWQSFCSLGVLSAGEQEEGGLRMRHILKHWRSLNLKLLRYQHADAAKRERLDAIVRAVGTIKREEWRFLDWMKGLGERALCGRGEPLEREEEGHGSRL